MSEPINVTQSNSSKNSKLTWVIIILTLVVLIGTLGFFGYKYYFNKEDKTANLNTAEGICGQYNLKDNIASITGSQSPLQESKENLGKYNLFQIINTTQNIYGSSYEENKTPYNSWILMLLSAVWIGDGSYSQAEYEKARMPSIGYFNLGYDEAKNINAKKFHQIGLCNMRAVIKTDSSNFKELLLKNGLTDEKINSRILESEKNDEAKNLQDLSTLDNFIGLSTPSPDALASSSTNYNSIYENYYVELYNQLPLLLKDFTEFKDAENKESFLQNLQIKKSQSDNTLLTNEVARLKLGYENQAVKMFNVEKDLFVTFGQINQLNFEGNKDQVYLLARDLKENKIKWILPKYYVKDAIQSIDKKTIYALAFKSFESQNSPNDLGEIIEIDALSGKVGQKYNSPDQIEGIEYINKDNIFVSVKTDSYKTGKIINLKGQKQTINFTGVKQIDKGINFSPDLKYFTKFQEKTDEFSYPKKEYILSIIEVKTGNEVFIREFAHYGDLSALAMAFDDRYLNLFYLKPENFKNGEGNDYTTFYDLLKIDYKNKFTITETNQNTRASVANFNLQNNRGIMDNSKTYYITLIDNSRISINKKTADGQYEQKALLKLPQNLQGFDRGYAFNEDESFVYFASRYGEFHKFDYRKF